MALRILLVDPDSTWLQEGKKFFKSNHYEVDCVDNGRDAQLSIFRNKYFAVILNLDTKNHAGIQVLKYIKSSSPGITVVLTMNDDERVEAGEIDHEIAIKLGAKGFLCKPFEMIDLRKELEGNQSFSQLVSNMPKRKGVSKEEEVQLTDAKFTSVPIEEFFSAQNVLFDIFIKLRPDKYIKILHAGDSFSKDRIDKYKNEKKVTHLFFLTEDRSKYIRFCNHFASKFMQKQEVASLTKVNMMKNVTEKFVEEIYTEGVKPIVIDQGKEICDNMFNMIQSDKSLFKLVRNFQEMDPNEFTHCFLTSFFSAMIVKQFDWESKITTETVTMASMLHDIGKMEFPDDMRGVHPDDMTPDQLELYKEHPKKGYELLHNQRMISPSVKQIVLQHHEHCDGSGFPAGIRSHKIFTLAKIVVLANEFSGMIRDENILPLEGLKKLLANRTCTHIYGSLILEKFSQVFVDPEKINKQAADVMVVKKASKKAS